MKTIMRWAVVGAFLFGAAEVYAQGPARGADAGAASADAGAAAPTPPPPPTATETAPSPGNLGGPGESCRARTDCKAGLKCMNQTCTDEHEGESCGATADCGGQLKCINNKCTSTIGGAHGHGGGGGGDGGAEWMNFKLEGVHPFVGLTIAGGFDTAGITGNSGFTGGFDTFDGSFLFALNGGLFIDNHQLMFEIAPVTFVYEGKVAPGPAFEMTANYAYFIPVYDGGSFHVFWPLRIGAGLMAGPGDNAGGLAFFEARADLIGPAFQVGHVMIDLHLPTFRWLLTDKSGVQLHFLEWMFGTSLSYVF